MSGCPSIFRCWHRRRRRLRRADLEAIHAEDGQLDWPHAYYRHIERYGCTPLALLWSMPIDSGIPHSAGFW